MTFLGTLKRDLQASASRNIEHFMLAAPKLADRCQLTLLFDHQTLGSLAHENSINSIGLMLGKDLIALLLYNCQFIV